MSKSNDTLHSTESMEKNSSGELRAILFLLQSRLEKMLDEADRSYELLDKIGEKTDLAKKLEKMIEDPLAPLLIGSMEMNNKLASFLEKIFSKNLAANKNDIEKAFVQRCHQRELSFVIVLKDDNEEARDRVFEFLSEYEETPIFEIHPVNFHFSTVEMVDEYPGLEEIDLNDE